MTINEILEITWLPFWGRIVLAVLLICGAAALFLLKWTLIIGFVYLLTATLLRLIKNAVGYAYSFALALPPDLVRKIKRKPLFESESHKKNRRHANTEIPQHETQESFDPYSILGVQPGATQEAIKRAYWEQLKLYHPDRVQHLGEVLKNTAHEQVIKIQRAFQLLT